jgi:hypothetical protein
VVRCLICVVLFVITFMDRGVTPLGLRRARAALAIPPTVCLAHGAASAILHRFFGASHWHGVTGITPRP